MPHGRSHLGLGLQESVPPLYKWEDVWNVDFSIFWIELLNRRVPIQIRLFLVDPKCLTKAVWTTH